MATFPTLTMTRADWQRLRDKHKVPKGAAAKVSIGDALELVTKTATMPTIAKHEAATVALIKDLDLYAKSLKGGKHAAFATVVLDKVQDPAKNHLKLLQTRKIAAGGYVGALKAAAKAVEAEADRKVVLTAFEKIDNMVKVQAIFDPAAWKKKATASRVAVASLESGKKLDASGYEALKKALEALKP